VADDLGMLPAGQPAAYRTPFACRWIVPARVITEDNRTPAPADVDKSPGL